MHEVVEQRHAVVANVATPSENRAGSAARAGSVACSTAWRSVVGSV